MGNIQVFSNPEFGKVRTLIINDEPWFVGKDVAEILGYTQPSVAISKKVDDDDKGISKMETPGGEQNTTIINESGLYSLIISSKLPSAKKFKHWVTSEVLPSIRKTGSYTVKPMTNDKELDIRLKEANSRQAELYLRIADNVQVSEYKQILNSLAVEAMSGKKYLPLPEVNKKTYSATDIGKLLGVSSNKIGRLSQRLGMKIPEYGKFFYDKAKGCNKQVETFRYYENAINVFRKALEME